ncbi:MAG TPA: VCBS repeat-containing protein [Myxococcota bacterium]|nr:VCBS repeat-containing protein [Myxococcota bacterium]
MKTTRARAFMALLAASILGTGPSACWKPREAGLYVTVEGAAPAPIAALAVTVRNVASGQMQTSVFGLLDGESEITLPAELGLVLRTDGAGARAGSLRGTFDVCVTARDASDTDLSTGCASASVQPGTTVDVTVTLEATSTCGDGAIDPGEDCDGAALNGNDCTSIGMDFTGGTLACAGDCTFDTSGCTNSCGNGILDAGEACDGTMLGGADCTTLGMGFVGGTLACAADCAYDLTMCTPPTNCGNGAIDPTEDCDGTSLGGETCDSVTGGTLTMGTLACAGGCVFDTSACNQCGNATAEGTELCDAADLGGADCASEGFGDGMLVCLATCDGFDTAGCWSAPTTPAQRRPINNTYTGNLRPTFVWEASTSMGGPATTYEVQYGTDPTFGAPATMMTTFTNFQPAADLSVSAVVPVGTRYYWRVRACAGAACSSYSPTWWINLGRSNRDFNGDGVADLVVGSPSDDGAGMNAGRVDIYMGATTFNTTADGTLTGIAGDNLGQSVAAAGDVNGDGYSDLVVGAFNNDSAGVDAGAAYVYLGGPGATFDASADGALLGPSAGANFGFSVASAGDVNADGFDDLIVGGYQANVAYVYFGGPGSAFDSAPDGALTGLTVGDNFAYSVAGAGDANGDGFADVIVGAYFNDAAASNAGAAYLYFGGPGTSFDAMSDGTLLGVAAVDVFGYSVDGAGDVNNDGFSDVIVGARQNDFGGAEAGRAYVFFGGAGATFDAAADWVVTGAAANDFFGTAVAGAGDVNQDGFADIVVGAPFSDPVAGADAGRTYVYLGGASPNSTADGTLAGAVAGEHFGSAVGGVGDLNTDGNPDVAVGAPTLGSGTVYVFYGLPGASFNTVVDATLTGPGTGSLFGTSVASAGAGCSAGHEYWSLAGRRRRRLRLGTAPPQQL